MPWLREELPLLEEYVYANTPACGLLNQGLRQWRLQHDQAYFKGGSSMKMKSFEILPDTKMSLAQFFGCDVGRVALTPNFSLGFNQVLEGLDPKNRVLLLKEDYPSVNWPFESRGFDVQYVEADENLEERILGLVSRNKIDVIALSLVQWINGLTVSMEFLGQIKADHPDILILADGTQFCGAFELEFDKSGIDLLGASGYKWLLAGFGNAFFLHREGLEERIKPKATGFNASGGDLGGKLEISFAKHLEPGHLDSFNFGSLKYAVDLLSSIGMDKIDAYNRNLAHHFRNGLEDLGLLDDKLRKRPHHSTIFNIAGDDALFNYLRDQKVICSQRGGGIRLGFHLYNKRDEVDKVLDLFKQYPN